MAAWPQGQRAHHAKGPSATRQPAVLFVNGKHRHVVNVTQDVSEVQRRKNAGAKRRGPGFRAASVGTTATGSRITSPE